MTLLGTQSRVEYILAGHIVMCIGFGLLFTPLFTRQLVVGAAASSTRTAARCSARCSKWPGAAGVALFIALMTAQTARLDGQRYARPSKRWPAAFAQHSSAARSVALFAVACAFLVRKPDAPAMPGAH